MRRVSTGARFQAQRTELRASVFIQAGRIQRARSIIEATTANGAGTTNGSFEGGGTRGAALPPEAESKSQPQPSATASDGHNHMAVE